MEGSESEAIFNSLNINPQQFINEALNSVDDLIDDAFEFYTKQASIHLKTDGTNRSQDLTKGVNYIRNMVQSALDKRLGLWEKYCLQHCFAVPEGFSLPRNDGSRGDDSVSQDLLTDPDQDAQLASLREKLNAVGKESVQLNRELQTLKRETASSGRSAELLKEALQPYEDNSVNYMFQEVEKTVSDMRTKMNQLHKKMMKDIDRDRTEKMFNPSEELIGMKRGNGLANVELEDLQKFIAELKNA
ncbi:protein MIS12 homolog [Rutidosis leptorrhynchoides]|uniref:protein MIS12 homolog n=1 Tax=Rutidosis leptorrhynchoides TaxID=125765 RepID=UPI003A993AF0